jgi:cytochrome d ubiquinol oxidase subunit I
MATGFVVASVYAIGMLKGRRDTYHRRGLALGLVVGILVAPVQVVVGDAAARLVAERQPVKLAALEGLWKTQAGAPLTIGGIPIPGREETILGIHIPKGLSWLATGDPNAVITGLDVVPPGDRPNVVVVHLAFQLMVGVGFAMAGLGVWALVGWLRRKRRGLPDGRWFLRAVFIAGPATFAALESGWVVTEVGRQPWIVQGQMRTAQAVTTRGGIAIWVVLTVGTYVLLGVACAWLLLRLARSPRVVVEPSDT